MRPAGRLAAAIEVMDDIARHHRPVAQALADWGRSHRFAGAGDRSAIGNLVYDAMRRRASAAALMDAETPRALVLGAMALVWGESASAIAALCDGGPHAPEPLSEAERICLERGLAGDVPDWARADIPQWLWPAFLETFADQAVAEGEALAVRAPLDLRVNSLKSSREKVAKALSRFSAEASDLSPLGLRIAAPAGAGRTPNVQTEAGFQKGWFEVQDIGSQMAALLAAARPGQQVLDICAGAGGKTLALAAAMENRGQVFAFDSDRQRLAPIYDRLKRAMARNVQVRAPNDSLADLAGRMDLVVVDAPCTGSGVWRRRPDAKWRLNAEALEKRQEEQRTILSDAAGYVKPGGRLAYITCSLLPDENERQIGWFLAEQAGFRPVPLGPVWSDIVAPETMARPRAAGDGGLLLTPATTATDGFFVALLERAAA